MVSGETICLFSGGLVLDSGMQCIGVCGLNRFNSYRSDHLRNEELPIWGR